MFVDGAVACSNWDSHCIACSRESQHISAEGFKPEQKVGRSGLSNSAQRLSSPSWIQLTPAGLPCGMPGKGEVMEGAMQHAPQSSRHCNVTPCDKPARLASQIRWISLPYL